MPPALPDLPEARVASDSARAWAQADPALGALLEAGLPEGQALVRWGAGLLRAGRADDAVTALRAAAALGPDDAATWTNLGIALVRTGAPDAAAGCFARSVGIARHQPDTWLLLGMAREKLEDPAGAEADYRVALGLDPASAPAWKCLGALLERTADAGGAIDAYRACLGHGPPDASVSAALGRLLYEQGRLRDAHEAYEAAARQQPGSPHFRRMARRTRFVRDLVDGAEVDAALATADAARGSPADAEEEGPVALVQAAAAALTGFGHHDAALRLARRRAQLWPESASARYLLASLEGTALPRSPDDYLVESFDAFADAFDAQLVSVLGYDVPEKLARLSDRFAPQGHLLDTLDAGCGTGLCGPLLRPLARRLTGVDLSPRMLDRARARGVYDDLVCEELTALLRRSVGAFDRIVAADVLIYFGDLGPLFEAAAVALRPGGQLAASAERSDSAGYHLLPTGRFAHAPDYVEATARPAFELLASEDTTLRREGTDRLRGRLFVWRRRPG